MEFVIEPVPAEDERAALVAALEQLRTFAPRPTARWGRPEIELDDADDAWHASPAGWSADAGRSGTASE